MAKAMQADAVESGPLPDARPGIVEVDNVGTFLLAGQHPRIVRSAGEADWHLGHRGCQGHHLGAGLGVGWMKNISNLP